MTGHPKILAYCETLKIVIVRSSLIFFSLDFSFKGHRSYFSLIIIIYSFEQFISGLEQLWWVFIYQKSSIGVLCLAAFAYC